MDQRKKNRSGEELSRDVASTDVRHPPDATGDSGWKLCHKAGSSLRQVLGFCSPYRFVFGCSHPWKGEWLRYYFPEGVASCMLPREG